jgi:tRNA threonylcarbamoyladenosine biosynthesis protein TsaB
MILFIDTSKPETKIALYCKARFLADKVWLSAKNQSEELLCEIDELLKKNNVDKSNIEKILAVTGPGSYTGLRVGLSTANTLAMSLNIGIEGIGSDYGQEVMLKKLVGNKTAFDKAVMPKYLNRPKITKPK